MLSTKLRLNQRQPRLQAVKTNEAVQTDV